MKFNVDREKVIKYADKAFLGLALVFLALSAALWHFGAGKPDPSYSSVKKAVDGVRDDMQKAGELSYVREELLKDNPLANLIAEDDTKENSAGQFKNAQKITFGWLRNFAPVNVSEILNQNLADKELMAKGVELLGQGKFREALQVLKAVKEEKLANQDERDSLRASLSQAREGAFALVSAYAPYRSIAPYDQPRVKYARIPDESHRVAPTRVMANAAYGYTPGDNGPGEERNYVTIQARVDVGLQTQWCSDAANTADNPDLQVAKTTLTGYDVQVQQRRADGTWPTEWKDLVAAQDLVTYDMVNTRGAASSLLRIITMPDGDAQILNGDSAKADQARKEFEGKKQNLLKYESYILRPPFFELSGLEQGPILPYDLAGEPAQEQVKPEDTAKSNGGLVDYSQEHATAGNSKPKASSEIKEITGNHLLTMNDAGKTYRYRLRVRFLNPIFGAPAGMVDPKHQNEGWIFQLVGRWSEPSEPVTMPELVKYYFVGQSPGNRANFIIKRWRYGEWYSVKGISVGIGDAVTAERSETIKAKDRKGQLVVIKPKDKLSYDTGGVVVVDLTTSEFTRPGSPIKSVSPKVILYDPISGGLVTRLSEIDKHEASKEERGPVIPGRRPVDQPAVEPTPTPAPATPPVRPGTQPGTRPGQTLPGDMVEPPPPPPPPSQRPQDDFSPVPR